jgi:hypothetical protein
MQHEHISASATRSHGRCRALARLLVALVGVAGALVTVGAATVDAAECDVDQELDAAALHDRFAVGVAGITGADYQRALALPDGRALWTFQDAFVRRPSAPDRLLHNVALVQHGSCFALLRGGTEQAPEAWLGAAMTTPEHRWFWPLAATIDGAGDIRVFVAEMVERGGRYLAAAEPVATWLATVDPETLAVVGFAPAPDAGTRLYGWSIASDDEHTYLYGHCYRQFGAGMLGHHDCAGSVTVARVPRGHVDETPTYWDGAGWVTDPAAAVDVAPTAGPDGARRAVNPMQVQHVGARWIAVTKEGDWWGSRIYLDTAPAPTGPWITTAVLPAAPLASAATHNTYFASFGPTLDGRVVVALSNNRWDGRRTDDYRPTFRSVPLRRWSTPPVAADSFTAHLDRAA